MNFLNFNIGRYINNVTSLQFFQLFRFGILLLISIVFTKSDLGTGEIGVYETFLLIAGGVSFFWLGGGLQALLSVFNNNRSFPDKDKNAVFFNVFILFSILSILAAVFVFVMQGAVASLLSLTGNNVPYMKILFMYICVSGPVNMIEYIYLLNNKSRHIIYYGVSTFILQFLCVTVPVLLGYDLGYGLYGLVFINGVRFLWLIGLLKKYSVFKISFTFLKEYIKLANPLVISLLLGGSAVYVDGFLVSNKFDEATFAIFRYGARELPFVILLANALSNALTPTFAKSGNLQNALENLKNESKKLMNIIFPLSVVFVLTSKWFYPIVFNPDFESSAPVFNIYILLIISRMVFPQTILIGLKKTNAILYASSIEIFLNILLSIIFINIWGITGVAFATVIAFISEKIFLTSYLRYKVDIKIKNYLSIKRYLFFSGIIVIAFIISTFM